MKRAFHCPLCRRVVAKGAPDFPFCSERCRLIDLGHWAAGDYVLTTSAEGEEPDASRD